MPDEEDVKPLEGHIAKRQHMLLRKEQMKANRYRKGTTITKLNERGEVSKNANP